MIDPTGDLSPRALDPEPPAMAGTLEIPATSRPDAGWPGLALPTDRSRTGQASIAEAPVELQMPAELAGCLADLAGRHGGSLFTALLTGVQVVLARWARQPEVTLGTAGPALVRAVVDPQTPFARLLAGNATTPAFPLDPTVTAPPGDGVRVAVRWIDPPVSAPFDDIPPVADLTLEFAPTADGAVRVAARYDAELFDPPTVGRLIGRLPILLAGAVVDPDRPVGDLPLLDEEERRILLTEWGVNRVPYPADRCVPELVAEQAREYPEAVAVQDGDRVVTYAELDAWANRLGHLLRETGLRPGAVVGVCLPRGAELYAVLLAVLRVGCAYLPLDPAYPADRLAFMLDDSGATICLAERALADKLSAGDIRMVRLDEERDALAARSADPPAVSVGPRDAAYVIYTSGSTGRPKGTVIEHRSIIRLVCNADYAPLRADDVVAQAADVTFDAATFEIWGPLVVGARIVVVAKDVLLDPPALVQTLVHHGITTLFLTTAVFNQVVDADPSAFRTLRHLLKGGEAANPARAAQVLAAEPPGRLVHVYGPTETTTFATWHLITEADPARTLPIGRPIANSTVYVLDDRRQPVPVGMVGELYISGPGLARGYLNRPELTAERFLDNPYAEVPDDRLYRTGDLVYWSPDGVLEYLSRVDHQVKLRGYRVELGEVELVLQQHPDVAGSVVVLRADGEHKWLVGYVRPVTGRHPGPNQLREFVAARLPEFMVPAAIVPLDEFPLTGNGKVDRTALPDPDLVADDLVEPRTETERLLASIWSEVLGLSRVGVFDNFYELGGDSVLGIKVVARARRVGLTLAARDVFRRQTIAELATVVEDAPSGRPAGSTVA